MAPGGGGGGGGGPMVGFGVLWLTSRQSTTASNHPAGSAATKQQSPTAPRQRGQLGASAHWRGLTPVSIQGRKGAGGRGDGGSFDR